MREFTFWFNPMFLNDEIEEKDALRVSFIIFVVSKESKNEKIPVLGFGKYGSIQRKSDDRINTMGTL